jgi:hypothetical protein
MNKVRAEFTPGPWEAHDDDGTGTLPCVLSDKVNAGGNFYVAQCNVFEDARLIASAPDLLDLAKSACSLWGFMASDMSLSKDEREAANRKHLEAHAAIAKAEGRD